MRILPQEEPEELYLLAKHGFDFVTLGPRTLRTDVALTALIALFSENINRCHARANFP